jgi:hypothetical protein
MKSNNGCTAGCVSDSTPCWTKVRRTTEQTSGGSSPRRRSKTRKKRIKMKQPSKYYTASIWCNGRGVPVAVWNGVHDYESPPPIGLVALMNQTIQAHGEPGSVAIIQVNNKKVGQVISRLNALSKAHAGIIFWARNENVYRSLVTTMGDKAKSENPSHEAVKMAGARFMWPSD